MREKSIERLSYRQEQRLIPKGRSRKYLLLDLVM